MRFSIFGAGLTAAITLGSASIAGAADLDPIPVEPYYPPVQQSVSGWYIRGDLGYTFETHARGNFNVYGSPGTYEYERFSHKWRGDASVGIGYQFNHYLRGDLTLGYWARHMKGEAGLNWAGETWSFDDNSKIKAWETMANAYVDLKRFGRFTPYIGGGLGMTFMKYGKLTNNATCQGPACGADFVGYHDGLSSTRFTWALMAGTSVEMTERLKLDFGYRFVKVEGGEAYGYDQFDTALGASGPQTWDHGFSSHQLRIGARYTFN